MIFIDFHGSGGSVGDCDGDGNNATAAAAAPTSTIVMIHLLLLLYYYCYHYASINITVLILILQLIFLVLLATTTAVTTFFTTAVITTTVTTVTTVTVWVKASICQASASASYVPFASVSAAAFLSHYREHILLFLSSLYTPALKSSSNLFHRQGSCLHSVNFDDFVSNLEPLAPGCGSTTKSHACEKKRTRMRLHTQLLMQHVTSQCNVSDYYVCIRKHMCMVACIHVCLCLCACV